MNCWQKSRILLVAAEGFVPDPNWKVDKVNSITYTVRGPGLGMEQELTHGQWTYYTDSEKLIPNDQASTVLLKVLTGK